ncbi:MAG: GNAT family N-acetyltransferase [Candidatus Pacebacteria bacterium]|nr:GNAT family N-acetyltransferase [Candidatus Paceibacterota bacterium]
MKAMIKQFTGDINGPVSRDFVNLYKKVFAEPPYFESYEDCWIFENIWHYHLVKGCIFLAFDKDKLIGFGCGVGMDKVEKFLPQSSALDPLFKVKCFLRDEASEYINGNSFFYMSEIGVDSKYRRQGVGGLLITRRWLWAAHNNYKNYLMRTDELNSNSRSLYENLGAEILPIKQDVSDHAAIINSASKTRIYLHGSL